jgi:hypothetical protein
LIQHPLSKEGACGFVRKADKRSPKAKPFHFATPDGAVQLNDLGDAAQVRNEI